MTRESVQQRLSRVLSRVRLRWVLVVPFVLSTVGAVALVGYLSYRSGQQAVENLANQLLQQTSGRVSDRLDSYLQTPQHVVAANRLAIEQGTLNVDNSEQLRQQLWQQMLLDPSLPSNGFWSTEGNAISYVRINSKAAQQLSEKVSGQTIPLGTVFFNTIKPNQRQYFWIDAEGKPTKLIYQLNDDFRTVPWYRDAQKLTKPGWTPVSLARVIPLLQTMAITPVYDSDEKLQGFFCAGYLLPQISLFLNQLQFSPHGQVFIMEPSGDLIATSVAAEAAGLRQVQGKLDRLPATVSQDERTREVASQLQQQVGTFQNLNQVESLTLSVKGQRQFVQVTPYRDSYELNWLVVTVIPESDFMAEITANAQRTLILSLWTLAIAVGMGTSIAHWITRPILRLNQTAKSITQGDLEQPIALEGVQEISELSQSLQQMTTQLRLSLRAVQANEQKFSTLLNSVPVGVSVFDRAGQIILVNQVGQQILGLKVGAEVASEKIADAYQVYVADTEQLYPPDRLPSIRALQGERVSADDMELVVQGQRIPVEVYATPVCDDDGNVLYAINAFQDITERRRVERLQANYEQELERQVVEKTAALQESEARKQAILLAIPDRIFLVRCDGTYLDAMSTLDGSGSSMPDHCWVGKSLYDYLPLEIADRYLHAIQAVLRKGGQENFQHTHPSECHRYEDVRVVPCGTDTAVVIVRDITERLAINRMKDEFISIVTHELRTPLTAIRASLGLLASGTLDEKPKTAQRMIQVAERNSDRLVRLVNDILNLERLESGKVPFVMQPCLVDDLMQQAVAAVEAIAIEANITLSVTSPDLEVKAAPDAILQTLINLLSNAIKFSHAGEIVWLKAELGGSGREGVEREGSVEEREDSPLVAARYLRFSVTDQGRGIPADKLESIFGRFQQVDSSDSREKSGTGLGLAICKNIVQQHGGQIWAESKLNCGSTFYFTLPLT